MKQVESDGLSDDSDHESQFGKVNSRKNTRDNDMAWLALQVTGAKKNPNLQHKLADYHSNMFDFFGVELDPLPSDLANESSRNQKTTGQKNGTQHKTGMRGMFREHEKVLYVVGFAP